MGHYYGDIHVDESKKINVILKYYPVEVYVKFIETHNDKLMINVHNDRISYKYKLPLEAYDDIKIGENQTIYYIPFSGKHYTSGELEEKMREEGFIK